MRVMKKIKILSVFFIMVGVIIINVNPAMTQTPSPNIRIIHHNGLEIKLDLSTQVLGLDIPEDKHIDWEAESERKVEAELYPTIKSFRRGRRNFVSASIFVAKAKQFDDGLYAAVEYLCQEGTDSFIGKRELLQKLAKSFEEIAKEKDIDEKSLRYCRSFINAAANLGGQDISATRDVNKNAGKIVSGFLSNQLRSKPIGFYTWSEELSKIFQQDRLLQESLDSDKKIRLLARGLSEDKNTMTAYQAYLSLVKKLTNPFPPEYCDLSKIQNIKKGMKYSFFPPSQAHETELGKGSYGNKPIPGGFSLIDALVQKIQEREIDLTPKEESGWYDYQVFALEPFLNCELMPEAKKLHFSTIYKKELIDLFKASIALTRETHIKQLEIPLMGMAFPPPKIKIYPELSIEPIATYYLRRAESYSFVRELLESTFGQITLKNAHRLTASGKVSKPLWDELLETESLFYGAYQVVTEEIGMDITTRLQGRSEKQKGADKKFSSEWISNFTDDIDLRTDNRMMVPVFYDIERKKIKVWVVLGYSVKPLSISFKQEPKATVTNTDGKKAAADLDFESTQESLLYPVSAEIYVNKLLNRNEFRSLCDKYKTQSAILNALSDL